MIKKCIWCGKIFETEKGNKKRCPECTKLYKSNVKRSSVKPFLSVNDVMHIAAVYDAVNGTQIFNHYGEISKIINNTNVGTCACCGGAAPKGKAVCPTCEEKYKNHLHGGKR